MSEFVEVKTADLKGAALDWAVSIAEGAKPERPQDGQVSFDGCHMVCGTSHLEHGFLVRHYSPSTDWAQGGRLIEKHVTALNQSGTESWWAHAEDRLGLGPTPLIAGCRAIVASALGDSVKIPKELCHD